MLTINNFVNNLYIPKTISKNARNNVYLGSLKNQSANDEFIKSLKKFDYLNNLMEQETMTELFDSYDVNEFIQKPFYQ